MSAPEAKSYVRTVVRITQIDREFVRFVLPAWSETEVMVRHRTVLPSALAQLLDGVQERGNLPFECLVEVPLAAGYTDLLSFLVNNPSARSDLQFVGWDWGVYPVPPSEPVAENASRRPVPADAALRFARRDGGLVLNEEISEVRENLRRGDGAAVLEQLEHENFALLRALLEAAEYVASLDLDRESSEAVALRTRFVCALVSGGASLALMDEKPAEFAKRVYVAAQALLDEDRRRAKKGQD